MAQTEVPQKKNWTSDLRGKGLSSSDWGLRSIRGSEFQSWDLEDGVGSQRITQKRSEVVHALFSQDGCQREGFWEVVGHVSPFDLS